MSVNREQHLHLQSQLEGLESIFLELIPSGIELRRQEIQEYYNQRLNWAINPTPSVAGTELRRQFNTRANQVRNLVDFAESIGNTTNKLNLIQAAATLPEERNKLLPDFVIQFCQECLNNARIDPQLLNQLLKSPEIKMLESRVLLACMMFLTVDELDCGGQRKPLSELLNCFIERVVNEKLLEDNDPFLMQANYVLEALN